VEAQLKEREPHGQHRDQQAEHSMSTAAVQAKSQMAISAS